VAEALLHVTSQTDSVNIALGDQDLSLTNIAGNLSLPVQNGTISNLVFTGTGIVNVGTGAGQLHLPATAGTLAGGTADGTIDFPNNLALPGIPLPAIVPVAVNLTPSGPLSLPVSVSLTVDGPSAATRFGLMFGISNVTVGNVGGVNPNLGSAITPTLQGAVDQIVAQLGLVPALQSPIDPAAIGTLVGPIPNLIKAAFADALMRLIAETGRLTFPAAGTGASCDVKVLPTGADAQLIASPTGGFLLQVGFKRATSMDIPAFPPLTGAVECSVLVGNSLLLEMLCCLVERLPAFALPMTSTTSMTAVDGTTHLSCCNFTGVTANFAGITIGGGGLSVCVDGTVGMPGKTFSIIGSFTQGVPTGLPFVGTIATISIAFTIPVMFDLEDLSSIANLRVVGPVPPPMVKVTPNTIGLAIAGVIGVVAGFVVFSTGGFWGALLGGILGLLLPLVVVIVIFLLIIACDAANYLIGNAVQTVLAGASLLRSPVAIPPALFEAFGQLAPVTITVDDLKADGVLRTPTSPWALLPRVGPRKKKPPKDGRDPRPPLTHSDQPQGRGKGKSKTPARPRTTLRNRKAKR